MQPAQRPSPKQEQKTAAMRTRLLEATIACLHETGYAGASTNDVIKRAGVSRGAMLYHFPSKLDLVIAAAEHASERTIESFRAGVSATEDGDDRVAKARELLWREFTGPRFYALLELAVASRTAPQLNRHLRAIADRYEAVIVEMARALFPGLADDDEQFEQNRATLFFLLQGIALNRIVQPDDARALRTIERVVDAHSADRRR